MSNIYVKNTLIILLSVLYINLSAQTITAGRYKIDHHAYDISIMVFGNTTRLFIRENNKLHIQEAPDKLGSIYAIYEKRRDR